ncbi:MAG: hypothetical protein ACJAT7_001572 [Psychromonas sp.]|jgi:hypothetical protein|uniref:hypothetical protein n=1 Tax=Psychromonas sp. TaxID=1884585 RepID=UPI0039E63061
MELLLIISINLLVTTAFLWLGMKSMQVVTGVGWSGEYCPFRYLALAALISSVVTIIPYIGFILSWVALLFLLIKFTETSLKDVIIMVVFAKVTSFIAAMYLIALL